MQRHWHEALSAWQQAMDCGRAPNPCLCVHPGVTVIPIGHSFPGTQVTNLSSASKTPIFFATAGESGTFKIWSSATAQCVYEHKGPASTAGGNYIHLALMPGSAGVMVASADCNLLFLQPTVRAFPAVCLLLSTVKSCYIASQGRSCFLLHKSVVRRFS